MAGDASYVEVGFDAVYAGYHETGSRDGKLPRRGLLLGILGYGEELSGRLGDEDSAAVAAEVEAFLIDLL